MKSSARVIEEAVKKYGGLTRAARALGITRSELARRARDAGVGLRRGRPELRGHDDLIRRLSGSGMGRTEIVALLGILGRDLSPGTVGRRLREFRRASRRSRRLASWNEVRGRIEILQKGCEDGDD